MIKAPPRVAETKLIVRTAKGTLLRVPATLAYTGGRIEFLKSPYALKDEIKAMKGSRWHGYVEGDGRKIWSVDDCPRNRFQLGFLQGEDVYAWFDRDLVRHDYDRPLMEHQKHLADSGLTYHYQLWAAEMGVGKTLAAQEVIERSGIKWVFWVGPKSSLPNIEREFRKWNMDRSIRVEMLTYEGLVRWVDEHKPGDPIPQMLICDESSKLKTPTSQRSTGAQRLADMIRETYGFDGYVIEMSGTPSPKSPLDWWSQCEIAWPGFLREGSTKALERRLAFMVDAQYDSGVFKKRIGWKDNENKCAICGELRDSGYHKDGDACEEDCEDAHPFEPSFNEVAYMYERLKGLVVIKHKKDCLSLPDKRYRKIHCKPNASTLRVAQALAQSAVNTITGLTLLRELSDGFQYREVEDGKTKCPHCDGKRQVEEWFDPTDEDRTFAAIDMLDQQLVGRLEKRLVDCPRCGGSGEVVKHKRIVREVPCPKTSALKALLEENEEVGRIVIFAGFTGSVDRVKGICHKEKWDVVRCDGRGFEVTTHEGDIVTDADALDYWADTASNARVAFVAHPESGGMSLTLVEARMAVYWSNSFKPEYRTQSEDRIHRKGMDENLGCQIVDLIHLPTDERVLEVIQANRKLELMTMGDFRDALTT
ncbi:MAG: ATP-dependent helicase [Planctomycetota bacterium]|nr:MAG: ATP-dependent helicase [Planctomycetota bacterium]REJ92025.1 MAG: ATP-dependent helicase [Planctomycetota bacterium]REK28561.1 MAG: ATP-dependent helicase [Planctomycetota bacterium]REK39176.1 MAG: ATP-dependent helicase [Planctomycetota bacterium]